MGLGENIVIIKSVGEVESRERLLYGYCEVAAIEIEYASVHMGERALPRLGMLVEVGYGGRYERVVGLKPEILVARLRQQQGIVGALTVGGQL
ncbi:hypothetical protein [Muribaculum intestinale]|uniref:hypothetical protein n=1 Tax=Muribaculum intestinale TaxID=1796646 RepID=UPI0025AFEB5C|nr:hypothetical protein [Muribaculum intestinale]